MIIVVFATVSLTKGVTIQCDFRDYNWGRIVGIKYSCDYATLISDGNLTHVIDVTGNHTSEKTNADVKSLWINSSHQHFNRIPKGLGKFFPNLIGFGWHNGNLTTLAAEDLEPFPAGFRLYST